MKQVLKTEDLTKNYGSLCAVSKLGLEIESGQIFGLLGPNGSGKTTILSMLTGITHPTRGRIWWFGKRQSYKSMQKIGAIIEHPAFYPYMSAQKNLEVVALIKQADKKRIPPVLENVNLTDRKDDKYSTYSLGMKQRLAIAAALLHDPEVLILDEPTNGLDPMGIIDIRESIKKVASEGKTVVLASHLLDEVSKTCSHFAILNKGNLVHSGPIESVREEVEVVELGVEKEGIAEILRSFKGVSAVVQEGEQHIVTLAKGVKSHDLNKFLLERNIIASHLIRREKTLEKHFLEILKKSK